MSETEPYYSVLETIDRGDYEVTSWEAEFLESLLKRRPSTLSERQRAVIQKMAGQYLGDEVHLP